MKSETEYHVVFFGKVRDGFDLQVVTKIITQALKKDQSFLDSLQRGEETVIRRTKNINQATQVIRKLDRIGAITGIKIIEPNQGESSTIIKKRSMDGSHPKDQISPIAKCISFKQKIQYRFDTFMAKGSFSSFCALLAVFMLSFITISVLRSLLHSFGPDLPQQYENLDLLGQIYITFLQLTDPGNMAQDILSSSWYKIFSVSSGLIGVILLSALVAVITTALDQKLSELKRGRSKVIENGHTLIIGWNEQRIVEILKELFWANESEDDACVVILADKDKQEMDDTLRVRLGNSSNTRIVTRSGNGTVLINLDMVSVESAKSVIILATSSDTEQGQIASDALVIQTVLATSGKSKSDEATIVAEIYNSSYREIIETTFPSYVVTIDTSDILAKLLVQTSRSTGLSVVYNEILSFDGCEMYFYQAQWGKTKFCDLPYHFDDGVPIGVRHADKQIVINPPKDYIMDDQDEILIVAEDDSTIHFVDNALYQAKRFKPVDRTAIQDTERELIIGSNHKLPTILREFSDYVKEGSVIDIMIPSPTEFERQAIGELNEEIENISINLLDMNPLDRTTLVGIEPTKYNNVIILASSRLGKLPQQVDSENIVTLLLLRGIFQEIELVERKQATTKIITEVLESQNHALIAQAGVKDMIISNRLISMITAQISESIGIKDVYDDIFQEDGSEVYLKPLSLYFDNFPMKVSFADLISVAQNRDEVCFGIKIKSKEGDESANNGIKLIPKKDTFYTLEAHDCLVVVAEDEL